MRHLPGIAFTRAEARGFPSMSRCGCARVAAALVVFVPVAACGGASENGGKATTKAEETARPSDNESDPFADLRRPLDIEPLRARAACPRTPGGREAPKVAITIGDGPVYAVLGMAEPPPLAGGVVTLEDDIRREGWYWHKTLWAVSNRYRGPVLIRGARIDRRGRMRFGIDDHILHELSLAPEQETRWRYGVSTTLVRGPGCFAFQLDGRSFTDILVFEARMR